MHAQDDRIDIAAEWTRSADRNLQAAVDLLKVKDPSPDIACFLVQQCVEKYLKAKLAFDGIEFPKTHSIAALAGMLPPGVTVSLTSDEKRVLTTYATVTRYPGNYTPVSLAQAREAVRMARRVRREMRKVLPREAIRRRRE